MVKCVVAGCTNRSKKGLEFHSFKLPKDEPRRSVWITQVRPKENWQPSTVSRVCWEHFDLKCFVKDPVLLNYCDLKTKYRLKPDAVPTIFPHRSKAVRARQIQHGHMTAGCQIPNPVVRNKQVTPVKIDVINKNVLDSSKFIIPEKICMMENVLDFNKFRAMSVNEEHGRNNITGNNLNRLSSVTKTTDDNLLQTSRTPTTDQPDCIDLGDNGDMIDSQGITVLDLATISDHAFSTVTDNNELRIRDEFQYQNDASDLLAKVEVINIPDQRNLFVNRDNNVENADTQYIPKQNVKKQSTGAARKTNATKKGEKQSSSPSKQSKVRGTWCLCGGKSEGGMVKCDGIDCTVEWFHFRCVGLRYAPRGSWYCTNCKLETETYCCCRQGEYGVMIACDYRYCRIKWFHLACVGLSSAPRGRWRCHKCKDKPRHAVRKKASPSKTQQQSVLTPQDDSNSALDTLGNMSEPLALPRKTEGSVTPVLEDPNIKMVDSAIEGSVTPVLEDPNIKMVDSASEGSLTPVLEDPNIKMVDSAIEGSVTPVLEDSNIKMVDSAREGSVTPVLEDPNIKMVDSASEGSVTPVLEDSNIKMVDSAREGSVTLVREDPNIKMVDSAREGSVTLVREDPNIKMVDSAREGSVTPVLEDSNIKMVDSAREGSVTPVLEDPNIKMVDSASEGSVTPVLEDSNIKMVDSAREGSVTLVREDPNIKMVDSAREGSVTLVREDPNIKMVDSASEDTVTPVLEDPNINVVDSAKLHHDIEISREQMNYPQIGSPDGPASSLKTVEENKVLIKNTDEMLDAESSKTPTTVPNNKFSTNNYMNKIRVSKIKQQARKVKRKYSCVVCEAFFRQFSDLQRHEETHNKDASYRCRDCGEEFSYLKSLKRHRKLHTTGIQKPFSCNQCSRTFAKQHNLKDHIKVHSKKSFACSFCDKRFAAFYLLKRHKQWHTKNAELKCMECDKVFLRQAHLNRHMMIHKGEKAFACPECDRKFYYLCVLNEHRKIHTGEKPYRCADCNKVFTQLCSLKRHRLIHTGEKPFKCALCGKTFSRRYFLEEHKEEHATGEMKTFSCTQCDKTYLTLRSLLVHMRIHSKHSPFKCDQCEKTYRHQSNLSHHKRIHKHNNKKSLHCSADHCSAAELSNS